MTAFTTPSYKNPLSPQHYAGALGHARHPGPSPYRRYRPRPGLLGVLLLALLALLVLAYPLAIQAQPNSGPAPAPEPAPIRLERETDRLLLSATLAFELPQAVESVLTKGVPLVFVAEADVYRGRWYWYDKRVASVVRQMRLSYQPLTRRWRLQTSSGAGGAGGLGIPLAQSYDSLDEALVALKRIARWKVADASDLESGARHKLDFRFRLDLSQLPRPLQLGLATRPEWALAINTVLNVPPEP